jgi:fatty acid desaturase
MGSEEWWWTIGCRDSRGHPGGWELRARCDHALVEVMRVRALAGKVVVAIWRPSRLAAFVGFCALTILYQSLRGWTIVGVIASIVMIIFWAWFVRHFIQSTPSTVDIPNRVDSD